MRNLLIAALAFFCLSCNNESSDGASASQSDSSVATEFLSNTSSLENLDSKNPIVSFQEAAEKEAAKSLQFTKDNISQLLEQAKDYGHLVITVEDHTIVKIDDLANCQTSGSWGACMPRGTGYIKKGDLVKQDDYINNIIGRPDDQKRKAFLFK